VELGLSGRGAMVAAASKGLGRAVAESLVREGCRVSISSRSPEALERTRAELAALAPASHVHASTCDVSRREDLERWYGEARGALGAIDILVTNTGGPPAARFLALSDAQWAHGVESTLMNVVRLCRLAIPSMQEKRWGRIVHITSLVAKQPMDLLTISSTLRAGLSALTKTMASQLAPDGILVNALLPGHVLTDRQVHLNEIRAAEHGISVEEYAGRVQKTIPLGRFGTPREIGDVVAFLCSERASYVTGASLQVDGGIIQSTF
jgi:3-oxoacyl-[acyl-carrier protein] reductase